MGFILALLQCGYNSASVFFNGREATAVLRQLAVPDDVQTGDILCVEKRI